MTPEQDQPNGDRPRRSITESIAAAQHAITHAVAEVRIVLQRGLAEVVAVAAEETWPLMMRRATAEQKAKFRELLLKTVQGPRLTDEGLLKEVSAAARKALSKPRGKNARR